jgi:uncharacterized protein YyaL (SSP411 family)
MMRESFEDGEVAGLLNRDYVPVKVDREERPDVDAVYMRACQAMTGSGGWPLTAFLTHDQTPFFTGTYFPKHNVQGRVGLIELLTAVGAAWKADRESLLESGRALEKHLREERAPSAPEAEGLPKRAFEQLRRAFDPAWGGFGGAPKFPTPSTLLFLLRYYALEGAPEALLMAERTLDHMAQGGMFDHLGGGFCRYSTDRKWLIPHFEKMLYDNALLLKIYAQAYRIARREAYREVAGRIVEYLAREMLSPEGGFYAAQDADSEGREGAYSALEPGDALRVLGEELGGRFNRALGIDEKGNFEGASVPNRIGRKEPLDAELRAAAGRMAEFRRARRKLPTDDKILTEWNALTIGALATAARAFERPDFLALARRARAFIEERLAADGLKAYYRDGRAVGRGHQSDYAALAWADLDLYEATLEGAYLSSAEALSAEMLNRFYDPDHGDFFLGEAGGDLRFRTKEHMDGATISGNSLAADVFFRLHAITGEAKWRDLYEKLLSAVAARAAEYPAGACYGLSVLLRSFRPSLRASCSSGDPEALRRFAALAGRLYLKNAVLAADAPGLGAAEPTYHICEDGVCGAPIPDEEEIMKSLSKSAATADAATN